MSQIYKERRRADTAPPAQTYETNVPGPSMQELAAGARPSDAQMGHRVDLPEAIREKMESSFGADFSNVKLYESQTVADAGAQAMTQGSSIAFAPGQLDLTSTAGQAVLGHELSHVVSQARGESAGQGFLSDSHLEAQADRQGMMAAQGENVYSGSVSPIGTSSAAGAAGPMQAKKKTSDKELAALGAQVSMRSINDDLDDRKQLLEDEPLMQDHKNTLGFSYAMEKIAQARQAKDKDEEERVLTSLRGGDDAMGDFIRGEMLDLTGKMSASSPDLISENFVTRTNALTDSETINRLRNELYLQWDGKLNVHNFLNDEESAAYHMAEDNFGFDRLAVDESVRSALGECANDSRGARKWRERYLKRRREGMSGPDSLKKRH